ncbi:aspartyl protease family protein [Salmonirosea aquatica]|uniref:Signal protein PDZ n=1 Tax=Salmonirosea aquatica TaxID=2654236 RepID=A0A7C9BEL3_9BACT|nr:signal protein PDZ [Cytophagaceae bacterium SJW1-29]
MKIILLFALMLTLTSGPLETKAQAKRFGFHLIQKRRSTRIPFELHANLIIIPACINNSDTLHFILDTGVGSTIITDPTVTPYINSQFVRAIRLDGVGQDSTMEAQVSIGNTLRVGFARTFNHNLVVLQKDVLKLSELIGTPINGLIGYELFERFVVTIDFRHREVLLQLPEYYKYRPKKGALVPLDLVDRKPYIEDVTIRGKGGEQKVKLLLDTGAGHAVMLNTYSTHIPLPDTTIDVQLGIGLSGKISGSLGRLKGIKIGGYNLSDVVTSFPDSLSFGGKLGPNTGREGNVGGELLRRFRVTINYPDRYMVLKPIRKAMKETFEHDMSGMDLRAKGEKFNEYYVDKVIEDSPADAAGLQKDDRLMFIGNSSASELNMTEIYKLLQRKEGKAIDLVVNRKGSLVFTTLILKRII